MKKQSNLSRLLEIAGSHKYLTYASWVLSAISALIALVPFYYIWKMIKEVLEVAPNFGQAQNLTGNGWMAVLFAVIAVLVYIAGLMCSHLGAFRIATNLRIQTMEHIVRLPLGFAESFGSGKLRKIVNESSAFWYSFIFSCICFPVIAIMIRNPSTTGTRLNSPSLQSNTNNSTKRPQGVAMALALSGS